MSSCDWTPLPQDEAWLKLNVSCGNEKAHLLKTSVLWPSPLDCQLQREKRGITLDWALPAQRVSHTAPFLFSARRFKAWSLQFWSRLYAEHHAGCVLISAGVRLDCLFSHLLHSMWDVEPVQAPSRACALTYDEVLSDIMRFWVAHHTLPIVHGLLDMLFLALQQPFTWLPFVFTGTQTFLALRTCSSDEAYSLFSSRSGLWPRPPVNQNLPFFSFQRVWSRDGCMVL